MATVLFGAFHNAGQICMSTERILVPSDLADEFIATIQSEWAAAKRKSRPRVFSSAAAERIAELVEDAQARGARNVIAANHLSPPNGLSQHADAIGRIDQSPSSSYETSHAVLHPVTPEMRLYREESFGPTAAIIVVPSWGDRSHGSQAEREAKMIDEMVDIANDSKYGLSAAVWGRNTERALAVARRLHSGAVHINKPVSMDRSKSDPAADTYKTPADDPRVPHGGWKSSGWGRFNGVEGIRSFTQVGLDQCSDRCSHSQTDQVD